MSHPGIQVLRQQALALHARGDLTAAERLYEVILASAPGDPETMHLSGLAALQRGQVAAAVTRISAAVEALPRPIYLANLGAALRRAGRLEEAVSSLHRALDADPHMAEAHCNLASTLCSQARWDAALEASHRALTLRPELPEALLNRATALVGLVRPADAESAARKALAIRPDWPDALLQLGAALLAQKHTNDGAEAFRKVLQVRPNDYAALVNLGIALGRMDRLEEAAALLRQAITLRPDQPEAGLNLGGILRGLGELPEARNVQQAILARDPDYWPAWSNLAAILHDLGLPGEADLAWQRSLSLNPDQPDARYSRALTLLLGGDFAQGWDALEDRWHATQHHGRARHTHLALWKGEELGGRTILLHTEEGLGDSIQFVRYAPMVAARGATVVMETYAPLARLFASLPGIARVVITGEPVPPVDLQCPLQSLPRAFQTRLDTVPATTPYLHPSPEASAAWRDRVSGPGLRVGIVWAGNPSHGKDRERSIPFASLAPLWEVPDMRWFSLQVGPRASDMAGTAERLQDLSAKLTDFAETAAALSAMDLVIAVDTSVAHLAGALGRPVWLVLPAVPDWRWMLGRDDSPWYPAMRLFRQSRRGDWESVLARVASALGELPRQPQT